MKSIVILILLISSETFAQPLNNWLQFDGTNDFIDLGKSTMLKPTAALTVEIWAFNSNWSTMGDSRFISNTESGGYFIGAEGDYIKAYIMLNNTYNIPSVKLSSLSDGWHHFALTCDGRYTKLYVDGTLQDTEDAGAAYLIQYSASANNTFIGAEAGSGTTPVSSYFDGSIDEVRVWNVVRTQSEIQDNMNQHITTPASGLVGYWKLNESSGTTAGDETANGNDGVLTNMTGDEWVHIFSKITTSCPGVQDNSTTTAWGDYNNDGYLDFVINGKTSSGNNISQIYKNNGDGTFTEQTGISLTGVHKGFAAWGDYNNDGFLDIVITGASESGYSERVAKLYKNNRDGTFTEQTGINLMDIGLSSQDWGDYNNDGLLDLLMMGYPEETGYGTYITNLYKNNGDNSFTLQTGMNFPGVREGDLNWGDYNNDGFLDFIITGDSHEYDDYTEIYKNNGDGTFTVQSNISLPELSYESDAAWGDYNNDGFLDLLLSGPSSPNNVTKLYVNNQDGTFTELTNTNFKGLEEPTLAWGDYNNDGFPDIISIGQFASGVSTTIYKNNQDGTFTEQIDINLQDVYMGDVHWGDYDNDNDLDLIITGYDPTPGQHEVTNIYENHTLEKNTPPSSPTNLSASLTGEGVVTLSWDAATDAETPSDGLSYNIYVGSSPGTNDIVTPMANISNGFRRIPALGNTNMNTSWTIKNLDMGTYYWSVQAIDQSFAGSPFASEGSFTISHIPDSLPGNALTFDGVDDYVEVPDNSSLNSNSFTVEFWFKPEVLQIQNLVRKQNPGSGDLYWRIFMADVNGSVEFDALPGEVANCKALNVAYVDTWLHIAATYDNAGQEVRIYANGELKSTVTDISDMGNASDMGIRFSHTSSQLQGILDEIRFWNVCRTEQQIREHMHVTLEGNESGLVSYWQMNSSSGTTAEDNYWSNNGTLYYMTDDDWVTSTVATGEGSSNSQTETNGTVSFTGTGLEMNFSTQNGASITVTKINSAPNMTPSSGTFDNQYWVVHRFGTGSFDANLTFTVSEDLTTDDESNPSFIKLYSRSSQSDGSWSLVSSASSVSAANNTATFNNITSFSQFIICREAEPDDYPGNALDFDGGNDYVNVGNDGSFDLGNTLTIEAWIRATDLGSRSAVFSTRSNNSPGSFQLEVGPGNGGANRVAVTSPGTWVAQTNDNVISSDEWTHIAYVRTGTGSGTHTIYVSGNAQALISDDPFDFANNTDDKTIASGNNGGELFNGQLDELRIWNVARSEQQIRENMHKTLTGNESGLVSYYQFNESSGNTTYDEISSNDGTLLNMTDDDWVISTAPFGEDGALVQSQSQTSIGESGKQMQVTITTGGNATDYLGIYATGDGDSPITDEIFPGGVTQRSDILWGIKEYGDVTADIVFDYSNVAGLSDPSAIQLLLRNDAASAWTNVTAEYTRNDVNRTFSKSGVNDFSEFSIGDGGDNSLPVGLNSFTLTAGNGKVILNWVTESEIGNLGFIILRSTEKDSDYVELDSFKRNDQLKGSGNSSNRREYEYIDETVYNNFTYWYKLVDVSLNGVRTEHAAVSAFPNASGGILNVVNLNIPIEYALHHNYPNPFNPETRIRFDIPKKETGLEELNLSIFNCLGQKVRSLYTGSLSAGVYEVTWEGKNGHGANLPSGIYFLVMKSASFFKIEKMILIR